MATAPYALVTRFSTGRPWSEQALDTDFDMFMIKSFGETVAYSYPSQSQDYEFSCALPSRSGANSDVKGSSACDNIAAPERSRYMLAIRGLWMPPNNPDVVPCPSRWEPKSKIWLAVRARAGVEIPRDIANDRSDPYRRAPSDLYERLPAELIGSIKNALLAYVAFAEDKLKQSGCGGKKLQGKRRREELKAFENLKQLVQQLGVKPEVQKERPSTAWTSSGTKARAPAYI